MADKIKKVLANMPQNLSDEEKSIARENLGIDIGGVEFISLSATYDGINQILAKDKIPVLRVGNATAGTFYMLEYKSPSKVVFTSIEDVVYDSYTLSSSDEWTRVVRTFVDKSELPDNGYSEVHANYIAATWNYADTNFTFYKKILDLPQQLPGTYMINFSGHFITDIGLGREFQIFGNETSAVNNGKVEFIATLDRGEGVNYRYRGNFAGSLFVTLNNDTKSLLTLNISNDSYGPPEGQPEHLQVEYIEAVVQRMPCS